MAEQFDLIENGIFINRHLLKIFNYINAVKTTLSTNFCLRKNFKCIFDIYKVYHKVNFDETNHDVCSRDYQF